MITDDPVKFTKTVNGTTLTFFDNKAESVMIKTSTGHFIMVSESFFDYLNCIVDLVDPLLDWYNELTPESKEKFLKNLNEFTDRASDSGEYEMR